MDPRPRRSRLVAGCQRCRVRHLKCDVHAEICRHCQRVDVECDRSSVRFREGLALPNIAFPELSSWPRISGNVRFHDETSEITRLYVEVTEVSEPHYVYGKDVYVEESLNHEKFVHTRKESQITQQHAANLRSPPVPNSTATENPSPASLSIISSSSSRTRSGYTTLHTFTEREAILIRNFVENMALWADITDPKRHFETEVPARALKDSVLRLAVLAFSSRHLNRRDTEDAAEALQYHNDCVKLLIPAMSEPEQQITEDTLASVAILRQHEEMDGEDNQFHLTGTTRILNTVSIFGSSGGLGEAAAWLCLRQDIYVALTTQQPLRTDLENFLGSDVFDRDDDFACSSRMVFLLAKALQGVFTNNSDSKSIDEEVQEWYSTKPDTFEPIRVVPRGSEIENRFPAIWMLLPVHVVGLQYYHMTKIVLALSQSSTTSSTYETLRKSRLIEKNIQHHLLHVLGLAKSNSKAENTLFTARHSLVAWGWALRSRGDQKAAECLLRDMHERTGWNMDTLIISLRQQWRDEHEHLGCSNQKIANDAS